MTPERTEQVKSLFDVTSYFTVVGALMDRLPTYAALLSIIWLCIQISQSRRWDELVSALKCLASRLRPPRP